MRVGECSYLFIEAVKAYNKASNQKEIHNAIRELTDLLVIAKQNNIIVHFEDDENGYIQNLAVGLKGKATYHYCIRKDSVIAGLKGGKNAL